MKNSKSTLKLTVLAVFAAILFIFSACSEDSNVLTSAGENGNQSLDNPPGGITITCRKYERGFMFDLQNLSADTLVNDFHVIFDSTVKIIGWGVGRNWQIDANTTDTAKGKFGIKSGNTGQPILPGQTAENLLYVELKFTGITKKKSSQWWDFKWEATRDGIVVKSGYGAFPQ